MKILTLFTTAALLATVFSGIPCAFAVQQQQAVRLVVSADDPGEPDEDSLNADQMALVRKLERQRTSAIDNVIGSVIAVYGMDRSGGGSGVIIDPSGIALTNHHVIVGAGVNGWGGLADGEFYKWDLIGTDPGGDVAIIQMRGRDDFPYTPLGDSDTVRVGDWALAMGNPFLLTEDQKPTITLGIVSGVRRYQPGAGQNQLVYGNCIQVDSSINPGNSGGPLFNLDSRVIGINGRGSFKERGRVNVGLGYAISANQIKNFIPDLLATKLVEHGTLDANFSDREGRVVCSTINRDASAAQAGLDLGDELLEFEGIQIKNANQFTNLICTLPEDWPAELKVKGKDGVEKTIHVRLFGLPYARPNAPPGVPGGRPGGEEPSEEEKQARRRQQEMVKLLAGTPGTIRHEEINREYADQLIERWKNLSAVECEVDADDRGILILEDRLESEEEELAGTQRISLAGDGRFLLETETGSGEDAYLYDGTAWFHRDGDTFEQISLLKVKRNSLLVSAAAIAAVNSHEFFDSFGSLQIDGGDKAIGRNAWRMKRLDREDIGFYFWLTMYDAEGMPTAELAKTSLYKDCDRDAGGAMFENWQRTEDGKWLVPETRTLINGLGEQVITSIENRTMETVDMDQVEFKAKQP